jgi:flavin-dependent dehydrogenase
MRCVDAVVVGGGPAGSTCAWALGRAGLEVLVLDRARFPRDKPCAGWLTPQAVAAVELDCADYAERRVLQRITGIRTSRVGGRELEARYDEVVSYGVRRCEFDHYLLRRSGAAVEARALTRVRRVAGGLVLDDRILTPLLVGAGGHFCPVARWLGGGRGEALVIAQEIELPVGERDRDACLVNPQVPELYFCRDFLGYGWVFRKGGYLNVGFGRRDERAFRAQVRGFLGHLVERGRVPADLPAQWPGHAYLLYEDSRRRVVDDGVVLVGDAAGLAYSQSGEGIGPAIESGLLAAQAILAARDDYSRGQLEGYRQRLAARLGPRRPFDPLRLVPGALRSWLGARVLESPRWSRRLVVERWFLHRGQPALGPAGAWPAEATA